MLDKIVGKKVIGIKQCKKAILNGFGVVLYVANDADSNLIKQLIELANQKNIEIVEIHSMKELGKISGIEVNASATLVLVQ